MTESKKRAFIKFYKLPMYKKLEFVTGMKLHWRQIVLLYIYDQMWKLFLMKGKYLV